QLSGPPRLRALLRRPGAPLAPPQLGGGPAGGLRPGTLPVPLVVGLAAALAGALADRQERAARLGALRDELLARLEPLGGVAVNGSLQARLPHNLNLTIAGVDGGQLHRQLRRSLAVSSGSACSQGSPSHVLAALGRSRAEAAASIRFGLGRGTGAAEIDRAVDAVRGAVTALRHR
ncbi:MAG: aminotransferase class V-fold PLP-dependent enzyme, partial [Synechococcaceae cyanobacterium]